MLVMFAGKSRTRHLDKVFVLRCLVSAAAHHTSAAASSSPDTTIHQEPSARAAVASLTGDNWSGDVWRYSGYISAAGCKITPDCDVETVVAQYLPRTPGHSAPRSRGGCSLLTHRRSFTIVLLVFYVIYLLMKATYKCLQEGRPCTRANTGNKQRAQCWSASAQQLCSVPSMGSN